MNDPFQDVGRALDNWAAWQKTGGINLGYPRKAILLSGTGSKSTDEFCIDLDRHSAEVMEALIHDLIKTQRQAVYCRWLQCGIYIADYAGELLKAYEVLQLGMERRGLV